MPSTSIPDFSPIPIITSNFPSAETPPGRHFCRNFSAKGLGGAGHAFSVLEAACEMEIELGRPTVEGHAFLGLADAHGVTVDQIIESQLILDGRGLADVRRRSERHSQRMTVTPLGFQLYARTWIPRMPALIAEVGREIVRDGHVTNKELAERLGQPLRLITHALAVLKIKGWIDTGEQIGGGYHHVDASFVSPELKRWLETL